MLTNPALTNASIGAHTVVVISIAGAFVFGLSGALAAIRARLDLFGVLVLSLTVGLAGGTLRDILLNDRPMGLFDWRVVVAALLGGVVAMVLRTPLYRWSASIALDHHVSPLPAVVLGVVTATGGGVVRDVLLRKIPEVLRQGLYAVPATLGSAVVAIGYEINRATLWWYVAGAILCLGVRLAGMYFHINLPIAPLPEGEEEAR